MVETASAVHVDIHQFAAQTVESLAIRAVLRALLMFCAERTCMDLVDGVYELEGLPAGAKGIDVGDELSGLGFVELFRKFAEAPLANAEVALTIIVDSVVADCCADSTDIADEVEVGDALEGEGVSNRTALLGAGRYSAVDAVKSAADAAVGAAKFLFVAFDAMRL